MGRLCRIAVFALCVSLMWGAASGSPMFGVHTYDDWLTLVERGAGTPPEGLPYIAPVPAQDFEAMLEAPGADWPAEYGLFSTPELYVEEHADSAGVTHPGLVMAWGPDAQPQEGDYVAAAWDYVYGEDPDLSGTTLEFSIHVPGPCMFFSLNIIDEDGDFREWVWHVEEDPTTGEVNFPFCQWTTVQVNPETGWTSWNGALVSYFDGGAGTFDVDRVERIRFDENGIWMDPLHWDPQLGMIWNAWDHVAVTPEPGTMLLLGGGLLAMLRRRRRES